MVSIRFNTEVSEGYSEDFQGVPSVVSVKLLRFEGPSGKFHRSYMMFLGIQVGFVK